jgi:hypothetical protein
VCVQRVLWWPCAVQGAHHATAVQHSSTTQQLTTHSGTAGAALAATHHVLLAGLPHPVQVLAVPLVTVTAVAVLPEGPDRVVAHNNLEAGRAAAEVLDQLGPAGAGRRGGRFSSCRLLGQGSFGHSSLGTGTGCLLTSLSSPWQQPEQPPRLHPSTSAAPGSSNPSSLLYHPVITPAGPAAPLITPAAPLVTPAAPLVTPAAPPITPAGPAPT